VARYRSGPAGPHRKTFVSWLEAQEYQPPRIFHLLRGVHRFSCWAHSAGYPLQMLATHALEAYGHALHRLQRLRYPSGRLSHLFVGARHFVHFLELTGLLVPAASCLPPPTEPALLAAFRRWMQTHRGTTQATLNGYRLTLVALLNRLGDQPPSAFRRRHSVRLSWSGRGRGDRTRQNHCDRGVHVSALVHRHRPLSPRPASCAPTIAQWRLAALPTSLPAETVEQVLATYDRTTPRGMRDYAVLVLLACLGLRAGDVAALRWRDIDWHDATCCVVGTTQRTTRLLPCHRKSAMLSSSMENAPAPTSRPRTCF
jgi:hypothetical protein